MRIGIFTNVLAHKPSGVGVHVIRLLESLAAIDHENQYFLFYRTTRRGRLEPRFKPEGRNFQNVPVVAPDLFYARYFRVFDKWMLPRVIAEHELDLFHGPNHYLPPRSQLKSKRVVRQIVTYHDLAEAKFQLASPAEQTRHRDAVKRCLSRADHVIALSDCTRRDVLEYGFPDSKMSVLYQGGNFDRPQRPDRAEIDEARARFHLSGPYILFVGTLGPRKNVAFLLRCYAALRRDLASSQTRGATPPAHIPALVLAGSDTSEEAKRLKQLAKDLGIAPHVTFTGYATDQEVRGLYGGASLFVLPSLYEGFGMIVLEAMAYGVPVIATRAGAIPEVVADAGILVGVNDDPALLAAMKGVLTEPAVAADLIDRGSKRVGDFSWRKFAEETLALYRHVTGRD